MKEKTLINLTKIFSILVLTYVFYRFCLGLPSINIFLADPFYVGSLKTRGMQGGYFYILLVYMNVNLFLLIFTSTCYVFLGIYAFYIKRWAIKFIKYLSMVLLVYSILELFIFFDFTRIELEKILNNRNALAITKGCLIYFQDIIFYIFCILIAKKILSKEEKD